MRDYKLYLPHHRELQRLHDAQLIDRTSAVMCVIGLVLMIWLVCYGCVDAVVRSAEIQERFYSAPVTATYNKPAAFRLQTPTADQMDHVEHLLVVQQVAR